MKERLEGQPAAADSTAPVQAKQKHNLKLFALLVVGFIGLGVASALVGGVLGARAGTGDSKARIEPLVGVWEAVGIQVGDESFPVREARVRAELFADQSGWVDLSEEARALSFTWEYHKMEHGRGLYTVHYRDGRQAKMTYYPAQDQILLMTDRQSGLLFQRQKEA